MKSIYVIKKLNYGNRYEFVIDRCIRCHKDAIDFFCMVEPYEYDRIICSKKEATEYVKRLNRE